MSVKNLNNTLKTSLMNYDPFIVAHLIRFEKPKKVAQIAAPSLAETTDFSYITDAQYDIKYQDPNFKSTNSATPHGEQTYRANKVISLGAVNESIQAKASNLSLTLDSTSLGAILQTNATIASTFFSGDTDFTQQGFVEGDKISLTGGGNSNAHVRIEKFSNNGKTIEFTPIDSIIPHNTPSSYSVVLAAEELNALLFDKTSTSYTSYINREVTIHRAHINPSTRQIIGEPWLYFKGIISGGSITDKLSSSSVTWTLSSHWGDFVRVQGRLTDDSTHRALKPDGSPDLESVIRPEYASDLGFLHSNNALNHIANYTSTEIRYKQVDVNGGWFGGKRLREIEVEVPRQVDLQFNLQAKMLPVVYGVRKIDSFPIFVDTQNDDTSKVFRADALCEGPISGLLDIYVDDNSSICLDKADFDIRSVNGASYNQEAVEVVCKGRADRGDTLNSYSLFSGGFNTAWADTWNQDSLDILQAFPENIDNFEGHLNISNTDTGTTQLTGVGIRHRRSHTFTTPMNATVTFHAGLSDQKADSFLVKTANDNNFKTQNDYYTGKPQYWSPSHRLLDTAYVVGRYKIEDGSTTLPELSFVVRGRDPECFNYDNSYIANTQELSHNSVESHFLVGDTVTLKKDNGSMQDTTVTISDKWYVLNREGDLDWRFKFSPQVNLGDTTSFYMEKSGSNNRWYMQTWDHVQLSGTVPSSVSKSGLSMTGGTDRGRKVTFSSNPTSSFEWAIQRPSAICGIYSNPQNINILASSYSDFSYDPGQNRLDNFTRFSSNKSFNTVYVKNALNLSGMSGSTTDYIGRKITVTRVSSDIVYSQTRTITDANVSNNTVLVDAPWDHKYMPTASDTFEVGSLGDRRVTINPSMQLLDYLTNERYGKGLSLSEIDIESFKEAARECDTRSTVTIAANPATTATVDEVYRYPSTGAPTFMATVASTPTEVGGKKQIIFKDVYGKLGNKWNNWKFFSSSDLVWYNGQVFPGANQVYTSAPTGTGITPVLTQVGGTKAITLDLSSTATDGNPLVKSYDINTGSYSASGYSLYDSDNVKYWKYLGWENDGQRNVTRHQMNQVIDTKLPVFENINRMLSQFNGILRYSEGKYQLEVRGKQGTLSIVEKLSNDDIIGDIKLSDKGLKNSKNYMSTSILDPHNKFEARSVSFFNSEYLKEDKGVQKKGQLSVPGITNYFNARFNIKQHLDESRYGLTIQFTAAPRAMLLQAGGIIALTYSRFGYVEKPFRITNLNFKKDGTVDITADEHNDDAFVIVQESKGPGILEEPELGQGADSYTTPARPTGLTASQTNQGSIELSWTNSSTFSSATHTVEIYRSTTNDFSLLPTPLTPIATSKTDKYVDVIGEGSGEQTFYYWIRYIVQVPRLNLSGTKYRNVPSLFYPNTTDVAYSSGEGISGKGQTGFVPRSVRLSAGVYSFTYNVDGDDLEGNNANSSGSYATSTTITSTLSNAVGTVAYEWKKNGTTIVGATSANLSYTPPSAFSDMPETIEVIATETYGSQTFTSRDSITLSANKLVVNGSPGQNGYTVTASNGQHNFNADSDGDISDVTGFNTTFTVIRGLVTLTFDNSATPGNNTYKLGTPANVTPANSVTPSPDGSGGIGITNVGNFLSGSTVPQATFDVPIIENDNGTTIATFKISLTKTFDGVVGARAALVYAWKRSSTLPTDDPGNFEVSLLTGKITTATLANSWQKSIPTADGNPLYVVAATASSSSDTVQVNANEWSSPVIYARDGAVPKTTFVTPDAYFFVKDREGNLSPSTITITATNSNTTADGAWTTSAGTLTNIDNTHTAASCTVASSDFVEGMEVTYTTASADGSIADSIVIQQLEEGSGNVQAILSNPTHVLPSNSIGVVSSFAGSGTDIRVYEGGSELTFTESTPGAGEFNVSVGNTAKITEGGVTDSGTFCTIADHSTDTDNDTVDTFIITYTISGKTKNNETFTTFTKDQTLTKVKGEIGSSCRLITGKSIVQYAADGSTPNPSTDLFETVVLNAPTGVTLSYQYFVDGTSVQGPSTNTADRDYTYTPPSTFSTTPQTIAVQIRRDSNTGPIIAQDGQTISFIKPGVDGGTAKAVDLTTTTQAFNYNADGTKIGTPTATVTATARNTDSTVYYEFFINGASQGTASTTNTLTYTPQTTFSSMPQTIRVEIRDGSATSAVVANDIITMFGLTVPDSAVTPYTILNSNDNHTFTASLNGTVSSFTGSGTTLQVFKGTDQLNSVASNPGTGQFTVTRTASNITLGTTDITGDSFVQNDHTAISADSASISYEINVEGNETISTTQTFSKSKAGAQPRAVDLTSDNQAFNYNSAGTKIGTPTATVTATARNTSGTAYYEFFIDGTSQGTASTTNTLTYTPESSSSDMPQTVRVDLRENSSTGTIIASDSLTMFAVKVASDGTSPYNVINSNDTHTFTASSAGTISSFSGSGTTLQVFKGTTELDSVASNPGAGEFTVTTTASNITVGTPDITGNSFVQGDHTAMSADSGSISYSINVEGVTTLTTTQTFSKQKSGIDGQSPRAIDLTTDNQAFNYDSTGTKIGTPTATVTATPRNSSGTAYYEFFINGTSQGTASTTNTLTYTPESSSANMPQTVRVDLREDSNSSTVLATDSITMFAVKVASDGTSPYNVINSNDTHTFTADVSGTISSFSGSGTTLQVFKGTTELNSVASNPGAGEFTVTTTASNITTGTPNITGNSFVQGDHTAMSADAGSVSYSINVEGVTTLTTTQTFSKQKSGTQPRAIDLTTDNQSFNYNSAGTKIGTPTATVTATARNSSGTAYYEFFIDGTSQGTASTTNTLTYTPESSSSDMPQTIRVDLREDSATSTVLATDSITMFAVKVASDGTSPYNVINSNDTHTFTASSDGTISSFSGSGTTLQVFKGTTELDSVASNPGAGEFTVTTTASNITVGTPDITGNSYVQGDHTAMSADSGSVSYSINVEGTTTLTTTQTFSKQKAGIDGQNPRAIDLTTDNQSFNYDSTGTKIGTPTATVTATARNSSGTAYYEFFIDGTSQGTASTTNTLTYTPESSSANMPQTIRVDLREDSTTSTVLATDSITMFAVKVASDGTSPYNVVNSNPNHTFTANISGVISSFSGSGTTLQVFKGATELDSVASNPGAGEFSVTVTGTNITTGTPNITGNSFVQGDHTAMSADSGSVLYTLNVEGTTTLYQAQSFSKSKAGSQPRAVDLTSSQLSFNYDSSGTKIGTPTATITATKRNTTAPCYFEFFINGTSQGTASITNTLTYTPQSSSANMPQTVKVEMREGIATGSVVAEDSISLFAVKAAADGTSTYNVVNSNPTHTFTANDLGVISSFSNSGAILRVFKGTTELDSVASNPGAGEFTVTTTASNITVGTPDITGNSYVQGDHSAMSADTGSVTYTIDVEGTASLTTTQTFSKAKAGSDGTSPRAVDLTATRQIFNYNSSGGSLNTNLLNQIGAQVVDVSEDEWNSAGGGYTTITQNSIFAPFDNSVTKSAELLERSTSSGNGLIGAIMLLEEAGEGRIATNGTTEYLWSAYIKKKTGSRYIQISTAQTQFGAPYYRRGIVIDMDATGGPSLLNWNPSSQTGNNTGSQSVTNSNISTIGNGWYRVSWQMPNAPVSLTGNGQQWLQFLSSNSVTLTGQQAVNATTGSLGDGFYLAGMMVEPLTVGTTPTAFHYNGQVTSTITASPRNTNGTPYYEFFIDGTSQGSPSTTNTLTYTPASSFSGMPQSIRVDLREGAANGSVLATDTIPMTGLTIASDGATGADGESPYQVIISNGNHTFTADLSGTVTDFAASGTTIQVFKGDTELNSISSGLPGSGEFSVSRTASAITLGTTDVTGTSFVQNDHTAISSDSGSVIYLVNCENSKSIAVTQTFSKSKAGSQPRAVDLTTTQQGFNYDNSGNKIGTPTATVTATARNTSGTAYYEFFIDGTSQATASTTNTLTYTPESLFGNMPKTVRVDLREGSSTGTVIATDSMTFFGLSAGPAGTSPYTVINSNPTHTFTATSAGTVNSYTGSGTTIRVFKGTTELDSVASNPGAGEYMITASATNISRSNGIITTNAYVFPDHSAITADNASITYAIYAEGSASLTATQTFSKSKAGATGASAYTVVLTNENHVFPSSASGAVTSYSGSGTNIHVYKGTTELTGITSGTPTAGQFKVTASATDITLGVLQAVSGSKHVNLVTTSGVADTTTIASILFSIELENSGTTTTKTMTFTKSGNGLNSAPVFIYKRTNSFTMSATDKPTGDVSYTFVNGNINFNPNSTGSVANGWSAEPVNSTVLPYLWVRTATAASQSGSDTIANTEWSAGKLLSINGSSGNPGARGASRISIDVDNVAGISQSEFMKWSSSSGFINSDTTAVDAAQDTADYIIGIAPDGKIMTGDIITAFGTVAGGVKVTATRIYNGSPVNTSTGINPSNYSSLVTEFVDGSMVIDGSLSASAITTGTMTSGTVTVKNNLQLLDSGKFYTNTKTTFNDDDDGIWIGKDGTAYKLYLGKADSHIKWDGEKISVKGDITISDGTQVTAGLFGESLIPGCDDSEWGPASSNITTTQGVWVRYGTDNNQFVPKNKPQTGYRGFGWKSQVSNTPNGPDGGFAIENIQRIAIDSDVETYRWSVVVQESPALSGSGDTHHCFWVEAKNVAANGQVTDAVMIPWDSTSTSGSPNTGAHRYTGVVRFGTSNNTPSTAFQIPKGETRLVVGYINKHGHTVNDGRGGVYDMETGEQMLRFKDMQFGANATHFRVGVHHQQVNNDTSTTYRTVEWTSPRLDRLDIPHPSIDDLVGHGTYNNLSADTTLTSNSISTGKIYGDQIKLNSATIDTDSSGAIRIKDLAVTSAKIANSISSSNYYNADGFTPSGNGWKIDKSGTATFQQANIRGTINSGGLNVASGGNVRSSKSSYGSTAAGFFIGTPGGTAKFNVGNSSKYVKWTGSELLINGAAESVGTGTIPIVSSPGYIEFGNYLTFTLFKALAVGVSGDCTLKFYFKNSGYAFSSAIGGVRQLSGIHQSATTTGVSSMLGDKSTTETSWRLVSKSFYNFTAGTSFGAFCKGYGYAGSFTVCSDSGSAAGKGTVTFENVQI